MSFRRVAKRSTGTSLYLPKNSKILGEKKINEKFIFKRYSNLVFESFYWSDDGFKEKSK